MMNSGNLSKNKSLNQLLAFLLKVNLNRLLILLQRLQLLILLAYTAYVKLLMINQGKKRMYIIK
ncbi:unnamed protein product [Trichobilharzia regenti]|nr:unnamed protein product [Trichobilharzia regenti]